MPNRRSKVNRLPKGERTKPQSKIQVLSPHELDALRISSTHGRSPLFSRGSMSSLSPVTPPRPRMHPPLPALPDDVWRLVLGAVDLPSLLNARQVNKQLARIANEALTSTHTIHLSRLYRPLSASSLPSPSKSPRGPPPTENQISRTLALFPNMSVLRVADWPYADIMPDVASLVCHSVVSASLRTVVLSGVPLRSTDLPALLCTCPALCNLTLSKAPTLPSGWAASLATACEATAPHPARRARLQLLSLMECRTVTDAIVARILSAPVADQVVVSGAGALRELLVMLPAMSIDGPDDDEINVESADAENEVDGTSRTVHGRRVALNKHGELRTVVLLVPPCGVMIDVDLGMNRALTSVELLPPPGFDPSDSTSIPIRRLNAAGAGSLRTLQIGLGTTEGPGGGVTQANTWLGAMEELLLYGALRLRSGTFDKLGLSGVPAGTNCPMPRLRRLDVSGTGIERLELCGYESLQSVDFSGCKALQEVRMNECWRVESVRATGKDMPLRAVSLVLPATAVVHGKRPVWRWERFSTHQMLSWP